MLSLCVLPVYIYRPADSETVKINISESRETLFLRVGIHTKTHGLRNKHTHNTQTLRIRRNNYAQPFQTSHVKTIGLREHRLNNESHNPDS